MSDVLELRYQLSEAHAKLAHTERAFEVARTEADKLSDQLQLVAKERDEAQACLAFERVTVAELRAEVARLREGIECHVARPGEGTYECSIERKCPACRLRHAESETERLERLFQQTHGVHHTWVDARHKVAQAQREACALEIHRWADARVACRATPLVTEGEE